MKNPQNYPNFCVDSSAKLYSILCPQLILWIAEVAGVNRKS